MSSAPLRSSRQRAVPGWPARNTKDAGKVAASARNLLLAAASAADLLALLARAPPKGPLAEPPRSRTNMSTSAIAFSLLFRHGF